ncbi:hypothetical protein [Pantoea sp. BAV 3049]|uniref:hypothetical protein n=1 Tax=Pantoea sp. BAV 3049 TaxID=2654188 RepID=UPI00131B397E|nr:hypothetical protein [Pantoea sp. BAV 3049]
MRFKFEKKHYEQIVRFICIAAGLIVVNYSHMSQLLACGNFADFIIFWLIFIGLFRSVNLLTKGIIWFFTPLPEGKMPHN